MNRMCLVLTIVFLLSACSEQKKTEVPATASEKSDENKVVINDITYKLLFDKGYKKDKETIDYYLNEIEMYSNYIDNEIGPLQVKKGHFFGQIIKTFGIQRVVLLHIISFRNTMQLSMKVNKINFM
jgi:hypothetical protein